VQPAGGFPAFIDSPPHNVPENDRDRPTWLTKGGHFSHSQIPGNDHGDPGAVSFPSMLAAAPKTTPKPPTPPTPPKDMIDMATPAELADAFEQGIDQYNGRFYSDKGTGGIYHQQEVQYRADVLAAMQRQTDALNALAAALGKPNQ
jgi:hypothetical protein